MLVGSNNEEKIWNYLMTRINNPYGVAGLMGNMYAESALRPNNLQQTYEKKLGYTDESYTKAVDSGKYKNFVHDSAGYGLVQWTYWSLKKYLLDFAHQRNTSIGDLEMQLDCVCTQLAEQFNSIWVFICNATSVKAASNKVLLEFERPSKRDEPVQKLRASYSQGYYDKYAKSYSGNSPMVSCTAKSPNHSGKRTHSIDTITPHCVEGQLSATDIGACFKSSSRKASCNYAIGVDSKVCLVVDECNRSWCSSSNSNDQRAVTIECASSKTAPYAFRSVVYDTLVSLCVDICKRNHKTKLLWINDKNTALSYNPKSDEMLITVHRWFANKSCPGDWLYNRLGELATTVTERLGGSTTPTEQVTRKNLTADFHDPDLRREFTTTSDLHLREGAGVNNPSILIIPKGTKVMCYGYYNKNGDTKWLLIQFTLNGVKYTGFSSGSYLI